MAGLASASRCTEPEAAAAQYAAQNRVAPGDRVAVYDLGGGTFDACVLEKTDTGFRALGTAGGGRAPGRGRLRRGGAAPCARRARRRAAALDPDDPAVTVGLARLRRDCVEAKEALSTDVDTLVPVALPGLSTTVRITRAEFELMIRPALTETVAAMRRALQSAHVEPSALRSILLVGGSSRIPLVSEVLTREFSVPTALDTHPKHDVALGSVRAGQDEADIVTAPPPPGPERWSRGGLRQARPHSGSRRPDGAAAASEVPVARRDSAHPAAHGRRLRHSRSGRSPGAPADSGPGRTALGQRARRGGARPGLGRQPAPGRADRSRRGGGIRRRRRAQAEPARLPRRRRTRRRR